ncbi:MAG: cation transporter [Ruminococcaceae bacterium]|nr:cation transporter [Oscillospiraceae bacterium]
MTNLLCRRFVKNHDNPTDPAVRLNYGRLAGITGIVCNLLLCGLKLLAGMLSGSLAMIADAFNNLSDAGSAIVTLIGFRLAGAPPDKDHPFGHGRMEYLSAMGVAVLIIIAGFELATSAIDKMLHPSATAFNPVAVAILAVSIAIKLWMALFHRRIGKLIRSDALMAAGTDSRNDVICTSVVLVCAVAARFTTLPLDGYVGMAVALFVIWSGFSVIRDTVSPLLGQAPDPELVENIQQTVLGYEGVVGIHDLIVHDYGPGRVIVSLHAEVPEDQPITKSHDVIDNIEMELMERYHILACIHLDPVDTDNPETLRLKEQAIALMNGVDEGLTLHDFRVVNGDTHTNLLFDLVVPHTCKNPEEMARRMRDAVHNSDPHLYAVIKVEYSYT